MTFTGLNISYNQLANIDIPYSAFYETPLDISGNLYTSISFAAGEILEFYCNDTALTNLDLSQVDYFHYYMLINNNENLQSINIKNNRADFCFDIGAGSGGPGEFCEFVVGINGNNALNSVCVDNVSLANQEGAIFSEADYYASIINNPNVTFSDDCLLAVQDNALAEIKLYPNPVQTLLYVESDKTVSFQSSKIFNTLGQLVQNILPSSEKTITIDVAQLKSGTYFVEIISNEGKTTKKFIKL